MIDDQMPKNLWARVRNLHLPYWVDVKKRDKIAKLREMINNLREKIKEEKKEKDLGGIQILETEMKKIMEEYPLKPLKPDPVIDPEKANLISKYMKAIRLSKRK